MLSTGRVIERGSFSRARLEIAGNINQPVTLTSVSFAFFVDKTSFTSVGNVYFLGPKLLKSSPKVFCPKYFVRTF